MKFGRMILALLFPWFMSVSLAQADEVLAKETAFRIAFGGSAVRSTDLGTLVYEPERLLSVGDQLVLISKGTNSRDCHACSGAIGIHYLIERADGWHVTGEWLTLAGGGTWGVPASEWSISTTLLDYPVLYSEGGGAWQGCTSSVAQLVPLLPDGVGDPTDIPIAFDNSGGFGDLQSAQGKIMGIVKGVSFAVSFKGMKRGKSWQATDNYRWQNRGFFLAGERSLETC